MTLLLLSCLSGTLAPSGDVTEDVEPPDQGLDTGDAPAATLAERVTLDGLMSHLEALAAIGEANGDTRSWTSDGQLESSDYVLQTLEAAGYAPWQDLHTLQDLDITDIGLSVDGVELSYGSDYAEMSGTGGGEVSGPLVAIATQIPPGDEANSSDSGCSGAHFDGFPDGAVALVQRGTCNFSQKVDNALAAGASGVLIFNEGQSDRQDVVQGTLGGTYDIPVLGLSYAAGAALVDGEHVIDAFVEAELVEYTLTNTLAELPGTSGRTVMLGAHLDSVVDGPGLNDNGSGSALLLELAIQLSEMDPAERPTVQFAWWDGEEYGLLGSYGYLEALEDYDDLPDAYFNYDMVASPNGVPFVYDGDGSTGEGAPDGSDLLEVLIAEGFDLQDLDYAETPPVTRSDSGGFYQLGVPTGGIFTGAEGEKSGSEASRFGGQAGQAYDACYHRRCDDLDNLDQDLFLANGKAAAHALQAWIEDEGIAQDRKGADLQRLDRLAVPDGHCADAGGMHPGR